MYIKKLHSPTQSHMRGMDNVHRAATYGVYDNTDKLCGYLNSDPVRQFEKPIWVYSSIDHRTIKNFYNGFKSAKQFIEGSNETIHSH